jgi:hypothetical protein
MVVGMHRARSVVVAVSAHHEDRVTPALPTAHTVV